MITSHSMHGRLQVKLARNLLCVDYDRLGDKTNCLDFVKIYYSCLNRIFRNFISHYDGKYGMYEKLHCPNVNKISNLESIVLFLGCSVCVGLCVYFEADYYYIHLSWHV